MTEKEFKNETDKLLHLQRKDPIGFWLRRAHESALRLNLPVEFLGEAIGILTGAVSEQWVREQAAKPRKGGVFHRGHPLIKSITVAGDNDLVTIIELAIYLKRLFKVDGLQEVIRSSLRADNTFDSALLQLAWAYRFHKVGAQIRLEPAAIRGRGDIHLTWRDKEYMVECYIPNEKTIQDQLKDMLSFSLSKMTKVASNVGKVVRVLIRFSTYPDTPQRLELEQVAAQLTRAVPQGGSARALTTCAEVEVQEISGQPDDDFLEDGTLNESGQYGASADGCMTRSLVPLEQLMEPVGESSPFLQKESRVFLWLPSQESQSPAERISELSDRIAEKLKQTKTEGRRAKRIVIAQVPEGVGRGWNVSARMIARGIQQCLVPRYEGIAAIILTSRVWTAEHRFRYFSFILGGKDRDEIVGEIYQNAGRIDFNFDLLHDWR